MFHEDSTTRSHKGVYKISFSSLHITSPPFKPQCMHLVMNFPLTKLFFTDLKNPTLHYSHVWHIVDDSEIRRSTGWYFFNLLFFEGFLMILIHVRWFSHRISDFLAGFRFFLKQLFRISSSSIFPEKKSCRWLSRPSKVWPEVERDFFNSSFQAMFLLCFYVLKVPVVVH